MSLSLTYAFVWMTVLYHLTTPCGHNLPKSSDKGVAGSQKRQGSGKLNYNGGEGRGGGMEFGTVGAKMDIPGFENAVFM